MTKNKKAKPKFSERVMKQGTRVLFKPIKATIDPEGCEPIEGVVESVHFNGYGSYSISVKPDTGRPKWYIDLSQVLEIIKPGTGPLIIVNKHNELLRSKQRHRYAERTPEGFVYGSLPNFIFGILDEFARSWASRGLIKTDQIYGYSQVPPKLMKDFTAQLTNVVKGEVVRHTITEELRMFFTEGDHYEIQTHLITHVRAKKLQKWADRNRLRFLVKHNARVKQSM